MQLVSPSPWTTYSAVLSTITHKYWTSHLLLKQNLSLDELADMPSCNLAESTIHNKWLQQSGNTCDCLYAATVDDMMGGSTLDHMQFWQNPVVLSGAWSTILYFVYFRTFDLRRSLSIVSEEWTDLDPPMRIVGTDRKCQYYPCGLWRRLGTLPNLKLSCWREWRRALVAESRFELKNQNPRGEPDHVALWHSVIHVVESHPCRENHIFVKEFWAMYLLQLLDFFRWSLDEILFQTSDWIFKIYSTDKQWSKIWMNYNIM